MIANNLVEVLSRISAMQDQERTPKCCTANWTTKADIQECRRLMVDWCFNVTDTLNLNWETVWIAMSYLDQYLSSGNGKSYEALEDSREFQLAAITAYYIAVKVYEPTLL